MESGQSETLAADVQHLPLYWAIHAANQHGAVGCMERVLQPGRVGAQPGGREHHGARCRPCTGD